MPDPQGFADLAEIDADLDVLSSEIMQVLREVHS
jgi:hypothetical protein